MAETAGVVTATVMFTDMVGSTALRARLGDAAADEVMGAHDALLAHVVDQHGGVVVKSLGDGVLATFTSAVHALEAAAVVQRTVLALSQQEPARGYALRIGVSAGDISVVEDDVAGTPVVEAHRLCEVADGGHVLLSDVVRVLAGSRLPGRVLQAGHVALRGLPDPVVAHRLQWARDDEVAEHVGLTGALQALAVVEEHLSEITGELVDRVLEVLEDVRRDLSEHVCGIRHVGAHVLPLPRQSCA